MTRRDDFSLALRNAAPPPLAAEPGELDPLGIIRLIRRRFWQIVGISLLVIALALPAILGMKPSYYAESRLLVQNPLTTALASSAEDRMVQLNLTTEVERMLSREVAVHVIEKLSIDERQEFNAALRELSFLDRARAYIRQFLPGGPEEMPASPVDELDGVIEAYRAALIVAREPMSDVVRIGFVSENPELAAAVPTALLEVYLTAREESLARDVQRANAWLEGRIAEQTERVEAATATLDAFSESSGLATGDPLASVAQQVATLAAVKTDIERQRVELRARLDELESVPSSEDSVALIGSDSLDELARDLRQRRNELERLLGIYGENHSGVSAARAAVEKTREDLELGIDRQMQSMRAKLELLDQQDAETAARLAAALETMARLDTAASRRDQLRRSVEAEQATLERLGEKGRALAAEGKLPVADVEVLSPATPPVAPIERGRLFYLVAVSLAAGVIGLTVAVALEFFDRSVRSFQQLQDLTGITEAAMVPMVSRRIAGSLAGLVDRGHEGRFGEALRGLVLSLKHSSGGRLPTSLLVTSPLPGEGKSLIAAALAVEVAACGERVLLVDGDPSHGRMHRLFEGEESPGLAEYLRGEVELDDIIRCDAASGVDYIARGARALGRPRGSDRIGELVDAAKASDRFLIFDSSPVFASVETAKLAAAVERTLLVIRWGRTGRDAVESAMLQLRASLDVDMLGVINMVNPSRHRQYGFKEAESYSKALLLYESSHV